jgi:2-phosphosulfolactate phosphatase
MLKNKISVCLSPELIHLYDVDAKNVIVTDIFRATSCMVTAFAHGVNGIIPVATIEECKKWQQSGLLAAAEREAKMVDGFDLDNSPFSYMSSNIKGKKIAVTTTNGTLSISKVKDKAHEVSIGAFLNLRAAADYHKNQDRDLIILCAGWKGNPSAEDSLFAGALIEELFAYYSLSDDSALMAHSIFLMARNNMLSYLQNASHLKRLKGLGIEKDIEFCMSPNLYDVVPVLKDNILVLK